MDSALFDRIRVVLCRPQISGNVGAVCRAMLNFGPGELWLVAPECDHLNQEAVGRARAGRAILERARTVANLAEALGGCSRVIGATARQRTVDRVPVRPRQAIEESLDTLGAGGGVALVFGQETAGMTNLELDQCHVIITIPTCAELPSLNLATAAAIVLYELHLALADRLAAGAWPPPKREERTPNPPPTVEQLEGMYGQMRDCLEAGLFLNPQNPEITMRYLRRFFAHSNISDWELRLWRAIWKRLNDRIRTPKVRYWPRKQRAQER